MRFFGNIWSDVRYALRACRLNPGFTTAAVAVIAIGVGVNTGTFTVLNGLVLRDMPVPGASELVTIHQIFEDPIQRSVSGSRSMFSVAEYRRYLDSQTLAGVAAYAMPSTVTLGGAAPQEIEGTLVSCNYFAVFDRQPALGRGFASDTCEEQRAAPEIVLGHELWTTAFAADPAIVGRSVTLNGQGFTVAGIAPEGFAGVDFLKTQFFAPLSVQTLLSPQRDVFADANTSWLTLVGRRAGAASLEQVRAELAVIAGQIDSQNPGRRTSLIVERATPMSLPEFRGGIVGASAVVLAAFVLVLLIACANVANLLLARASARGREIALRLSLGATRGRLVQQLLTESVVIAIAGGLLGSLLAVWSFQGLFAFVMSSLPAEIPAIQIDSRPNVTVLAFAVLLTLVTGVLFGLVPALRASNPDQYTALKQDIVGAPRSGGRSRGALVGAQVAVCVLLSICAGLLLRGLYATQTTEPGFEYRSVVTASLNLGRAGYDAQRATTFNRELMARLAGLPGVTAVAQVAKTPLSEGSRELELKLPGGDEEHRFYFNNASPDYFSLLELPIVRGRAFTAADLTDSSTAVIINEATARRFWPGEEPLGKTFVLEPEPNREITVEVIGVVQDASLQRIGRTDDNDIYFAATPRSQTSLITLVRTRADLTATAQAIRDTVRALDPALVANVAPLEQNLDLWRSLASVGATLSTALGAIALVLAAIGVYGHVAYAVSLRMREIGIRLALGARAHQVLALVLRRNLRPVVVGAAAGAVACLLAGQLLASFLFGVSALDPLALGGATLFVVSVAVVASLLPARRALRVDPMITLRYE
jgi:putative ABC transport system permease protein